MALLSNFLVTSDWHFGHYKEDGSGILQFERASKFDTIQEHDKHIVELVRRWLAKLHKDDTFYFLGDFGRPTDIITAALVEMFGKSPCRKVAIRGNHDHEQETALMKMLFDEVYDYPIWISNRIILSHFPCAVWKDQLNIHGHLHGSVLDSPNHVCASIHVAQYQPINNHIVNGCLGRLPKYNRRFLWEPWADKYQFTQKKEDVVYDKDRNIDLAASRVIQRLNQEAHNKSGEIE